MRSFCQRWKRQSLEEKVKFTHNSDDNDGDTYDLYESPRCIRYYSMFLLVRFVVQLFVFIFFITCTPSMHKQSHSLSKILEFVLYNEWNLWTEQNIGRYFLFDEQKNDTEQICI